MKWDRIPHAIAAQLFTAAKNWTVSRNRWIKFTSPQPFSFRFIIVFSYLHLDLSNDVFLSGLHTKVLHVFIIFNMCSTCLPHHVLLELLILIIYDEEPRLLSSTLYTFLCFALPSFPSGLNILLSSLFPLLSICVLLLWRNTKCNTNNKGWIKL